VHAVQACRTKCKLVSEIGAVVDVGQIAEGRSEAGAGAEYLNGLKYSDPDSLEVASLESCHFDIDPGITVAMKLDWKLKSRVIIDHPARRHGGDGQGSQRSARRIA
jgi:hypothetical protein